MTAKSKAPTGEQPSNVLTLPVRRDEYGNEHVDIPIPQSRKTRIVGYYALAPGAARRITLSEMEWRLVHLILENQDSRVRGFATFTQGEMAEEIGTTEKYLQRRLAILQKRWVIYREGRGRYRVNSHIGFQGNLPAWHTAWVNDRDPDWTGRRGKLETV